MVTSRTSAAVLLAMLPAGLFTCVWPTKPRPEASKSTPSYREQVHPPSDFSTRFGEETPTVRRVRTVSILPVPMPPQAPAPIAEVTEVPVHVAQAPSPPPTRRRLVLVRRASLDICARHHMRKVTYGKRWRCRR